RKYSFVSQKQIDNGSFVPMMTDDVAATKELNGKQNPLKKSMMLKLFYVFVGGAIGVMLGELTPIHYSLWCLAIGVAGLKLGLLEAKALEKSNSFTLVMRSEEHTSELQSRFDLVCRLLLDKKKK